MPLRDYQSVAAEVAAESWRFAKEYELLMSKSDASERKVHANKLNCFLQRRLLYLPEGFALKHNLPEGLGGKR